MALACVLVVEGPERPAMEEQALQASWEIRSCF